MPLKRVSKVGMISSNILVSGIVEATICLPHSVIALKESEEYIRIHTLSQTQLSK